MGIAKKKPVPPVRIEIKKDDTVKVIPAATRARRAACCAWTSGPADCWWST